MDQDGDDISVVFGCYGEVQSVDLSCWVASDGSLFFETLIGKLNIPELNYDAITSDDVTNNVFDKVVTPENHKFTLTFWKSILCWQEQAPGPSTLHFTALLTRTLMKYVSWRLEDPTVFKITKFLAAGLLKLLKLQDTDDQKTTVPLLYQLYKLLHLSEPVSEFLSLLRTSLHRYTKCSGIKSECDNQYNVVCLLKTLENLTFHDVGTVFELLKRSTQAVAETFTIGTSCNYGKSVTLIQYVIFRLSGLCTQIRERAHLCLLEKALVGNLLSYNNLATIVCSDVLVFLARLAPPTYVTSLITTLCDLAASISCPVRSSNIRLTVSRLLPVADPAAVKSLSSRLASLENGLLDLLPDDNLKKTDIARTVTQQWKSNTVTADKLLAVLPCSPDVATILVELSDQMECLKNCRYKAREIDSAYILIVGCLVSIEKNWKEYRNRETVVQVLGYFEPLVLLKDSFISCLVLDILDKLSSYKCPKHSLYCTVCTSLLSELITPEDPYVSQKCVYTFATFAKMTPHPEILTAVAQNEGAKLLLTQFLQGNNSSPSKGAVFNVIEDIEIARLARIPHSNRFIIESVIKELRDVQHIPQRYKRQLKQVLSQETVTRDSNID